MNSHKIETEEEDKIAIDFDLLKPIPNVTQKTSSTFSFAPMR